MKVGLYYFHLLGLGDEPGTSKTPDEFAEAAWKFSLTYRQYPPMYPHEFTVVFLRGTITDGDRDIWAGIPCKFEHYVPTTTDGWDGQAFQEQADKADCDFMVTCTSRNYFFRPGWLKRMVDARTLYGDGWYGIMVGYDGCPLGTHPPPNPHIRGSMNGFDPKTFRKWPHRIVSRQDCFRWECGEWNIANWYESIGKPAILVTWDGQWPRHLWKKPQNIYRRGTQSNLIALDRHSDFYRYADRATQTIMQKEMYGE